MKTASRLCVAAATAAIAGSWVAAPVASSARPLGTGLDSTAELKAGSELCEQEPVLAGYYRMWRDVATTKAADRAPNEQRMDDVPAEVDIVSAFATPPETDPEFWNEMKSTYVPNLHEQGTEVVFTIFVDAFTDPSIPMTEQGYEQAAQEIYQKYIVEWGLDGLDIDVEQTLEGDDLTRATGVLTALGGLIGPQSGSDHLYIYDTNMTGEHPLFQELAPYVDYVFLQAYGRGDQTLQDSWETFSPHISSCQFLPGVSFYEERGYNWGDVTVPFDESRAADYARWQPEGGEKAGMFAYAIDRDGKVYGDDTITRTNFEWMRVLKDMMLELDVVPQPDTTSPEFTVEFSDGSLMLEASDDRALGEARAAVLHPSGRTTAELEPQLFARDATTGTITWELPELRPGAFRVQVSVQDEAGNESTTTVRAVMTPKGPKVTR